MTETTAEMANPKIRECAEQLARELHATVERKRTSVSAERYLWDEVPAAAQRLMTETLYSLIYRGIILCPVPEHRIGIDLRSAAAPPAAEPVDGEHQQGPDCPRCTKPTELRGDKRTPYCRICHQFVVGGNLGDCRARDDRGLPQRTCTCEEFSLTGHHHEACPALDDR